MTSRNVNINIGASTRKYKQAVRSAEKATTKFGGSISKLGKVAVAAGAAGVVAIAAIGAVAIKVGIEAVQGFAKFEQSMSRIEGLVGVAHAEVEAFGEQVKELAAATAVGPQALAEGLFFITSAGLEGAEAMDALEVSAKASAAGLGEVTIIADVVTSAVNAFGDSMGGAAVATDVLVATVREGKADAASLATAMGRVIPIASQMGISFDQVGASIAAMTRVGLDAAEASTALRSIMVSLLKPTTQADEALASMGLSAAGLRDQIRSEGLFATLQGLTEAFDGNSDATVAVFGNIRALSGVMALMGDNAEATKEIFDELANSTGALDAAFDVTTETTAFKFEQAKARIDNVLLDIGAELAPIIAQMVETLLPHVEDLVTAFGDVAVIIGELGEMALPSIVGFLEDIPKYVLGLQKIDLWARRGNDIFGIIPRTLGIMGDQFTDVERKQISFINTQISIINSLEMGRDAYKIGFTALKGMGNEATITADHMGTLQDALSFTDEEMLTLIDDFILQANAVGGYEDAVTDLLPVQAALEQSLRFENVPDQSPLTEFELSAGKAGTAASTAAPKIEQMVLPLHHVRDALLEAVAAQRSLADAFLEMTNPAFKAVKAIQRLEVAEKKVEDIETRLGKKRKISKEDTEELALAQLELVQATLQGQAALDAFNDFDGENLEGSLQAIQIVLGVGREEALLLLQTLGILDGTQVKMLLNLETTITGPLAGGSFIQGDLSDFEKNQGKLHGGPVRAGQPYIVGEGGEELFIPDTAGRIIPNGDLVSMSSSSTSNSKVINLYIEGTETPGQDAESLLLLAGLVA